MSLLASPLSHAFDDLQHELVRLDTHWHAEPERAGLRHTAADLRHHVCAALACLDALAPEACHYDRLDGAARVLAHEAYLAVLALGQLLLRAIVERFATESALARTRCAVDYLLDMLGAFVSRADDALRRVLLEDVPIEVAVRGITDQQHQRGDRQ